MEIIFKKFKLKRFRFSYHFLHSPGTLDLLLRFSTVHIVSSWFSLNNGWPKGWIFLTKSPWILGVNKTSKSTGRQIILNWWQFYSIQCQPLTVLNPSSDACELVHQRELTSLIQIYCNAVPIIQSYVIQWIKGFFKRQRVLCLHELMIHENSQNMWSLLVHILILTMNIHFHHLISLSLFHCLNQNVLFHHFNPFPIHWFKCFLS